MESFAQILFSHWETKTTAQMRIKNEEINKELNLQDGNIAIGKSAVDEKVFLKHLITKRILNSSSIKKLGDRSRNEKTSVLSSLLDQELLSPSQLWKNMEVFIKGDLFLLFDQDHIETSLVSNSNPQDLNVLFVIPSIPFIREGIHRMKNFGIIDNSIPEDIQSLQVLSPEHKEAVALEPHEEYLLHNIEQENDLQSLLSSSMLGEKNTKKTMFFLISIGFLGSSLHATPNKPLQEFSAAELHKILGSYNTKCSVIYKYVSKELGPVALNLMGKSVEDVKPHLSPQFQKITLGIDGKIDLHSALKTSIVLTDRENIQSIIKSLNEILTAEILTVKKTLGNDFESALIKNLEKISV